MKMSSFDCTNYVIFIFNLIPLNYDFPPLNYVLHDFFQVKRHVYFI